MAVQIILKNSSVEDKRPSANQLANGEVSLNYHEDGAFLCCRDTEGNIQQIGGIKISPDAPGTPVKGTLWLQPATSTLFVYDGGSWLAIAGGGSGGGGGGGAIDRIIAGDGIDVSPSTGVGVVTVNADVDTNRGLEIVAGSIAVNLGAGLEFNPATGAIDSTASALAYRGTLDLTTDGDVPDNPDLGDTWANVGDGELSDEWQTATGSAAGTEADPGDLVVWNGSLWTLIPTGGPGGGPGATDLGYTPTTGGTASRGGTVTSTTGTNADIPMAGHTEAGVLGGAAQAGLMSPEDKAKLDAIDDQGENFTAGRGLTWNDTTDPDTLNADIATTTDPGIVQAGNGLLVDIDGVLSVDGSEITEGIDLGYTAAAQGGTVTNSAGDDANIPQATAALSGLFNEAPTPLAGDALYARQVTNAGQASWQEIPPAEQPIWQRENDGTFDVISPIVGTDNLAIQGDALVVDRGFVGVGGAPLADDANNPRLQINGQAVSTPTDAADADEVLATKGYVDANDIGEAPEDGGQYARQDAGWVEIAGGGGGIPDAPADGNIYGRQDNAWVEVGEGGGLVGAIVPWASAVIPDGWLECNGQAIPLQFQELIDLIGANVPDLRGEFIRGLDNGRGVDAGRVLGSTQGDEYRNHDHTASDSGHQHAYNSAIARTLADGGANGAYMSTSTNTTFGYANITVNSSGGVETRPRNVALIYIINAAGAAIGGGGGGGGIPEAPVDGQQYARQDADWTVVQPGGGIGASAWVTFAATRRASDNANPGAGDDLVIWGSSNVARVVYSAEGSYSIEFQNAMPSAEYAVTGSATLNLNSAATPRYLSVNAKDNATATGCQIYVVDDLGAFSDCSYVSVVFHATNAEPPRGGTGADAWATHSGTSNVIESSFNIDTIARVPGQAVGHWRVTFTTAMPTNTYGVVGSCFNITAASDYTFVVSEKRTDGFDYYCTEALGGGGVQFSDEAVSFVVHATNAQLPDTVTQEQLDAALNSPGISAWGSINDVGTINGSLNIDRVVLAGANAVTVHFQNPMPNTDYAVALGGGGTEARVSAKAATAFTVETFDSAGTPGRFGFDFTVTATNNTPPRGGTGADCFGSVVNNALAASFNVNNVQNPEVGRYIIMFETPMPTANYSVNCTAGITNFKASQFNKTVDGFEVFTVDLAQAGGIVQANVDFDFVVHATNAQLPNTLTQDEVDEVLAVVRTPGAITNVVRTEFYEELALVNVTATVLTNSQNDFFDFTPVSANSTIIVDYSFTGSVPNQAGINTLMEYAIGDGTNAITTAQRHTVFTASGDNGITSPVNIKCFLPNNDLTPKRFSLMALVGGAYTGNIFDRRCVITEVLNTDINLFRRGVISDLERKVQQLEARLNQLEA